MMVAQIICEFLFFFGPERISDFHGDWRIGILEFSFCDMSETSKQTRTCFCSRFDQFREELGSTEPGFLNTVVF